MTWRDDLRPASFRGVHFFVAADSSRFGRRVVVHTYPQRDKPYVEDLGRRSREYQFDAFVIGPNYMEDRDAFIAACEEPGAGELIHPKFGSLMVTATADCEVSETTAEGGIARIRVTFTEAGEQEQPSQSADTLAVIEQKKLALNERLAQWFSENFSVEGFQDYVSEDAISCIQRLEETAGFALDSISTVRQFVSGDLSILNPENLLTAVLAPSELGLGILNLISKAENIAKLADFSLSEKSRDDQLVSDTGSGSHSTELTQSTSDSLAVENNRQAIEQIVKVAYTQRIIEESVSEDLLQTTEDANATQANVVQQVDELIFDPVIDGETVNALVDFRDAVLTHLQSVVPELPRVITIETKKVLPATVIAYRQYGNEWYKDSRNDEIAKRNHVIHPGFVPAGLVEVVNYDG